MFQGLLLTLAAVLTLSSPPGQAAALTATESAWLTAAAPVLAFARAQRLPLSIIVQPQDTPGQTPIGMAFIDGHCVLVLSMRGNPDAQALLERVEPGLLHPVIEAIVAHEVGHCWRHLQRSWGKLPSSLMEMEGFSQVSRQDAALLKDMWRTRSEEGFADLVGLAWTKQHNPSRYDEVHAWQARLRADQSVDTGPHDTRVWIRLAKDKEAFKPAGSIFEQVEPVWQAGLLEGFSHSQPSATASANPSPR